MFNKNDSDSGSEVEESFKPQVKKPAAVTKKPVQTQPKKQLVLSDDDDDSEDESFLNKKKPQSKPVVAT
jgi:hypothetical protein